VGQVDGFRFVKPITYAGRAFGTVDMSVSKAELDAVAALSRLLMVGLMVSTLGVVAAVSYAVARRTVMPIRRVTAALKEAASGNLDFRLSHNRKDELGELFDGFNRLAGAVQARLEAAPPVKPGTTAAKRSAFRRRSFVTPSSEAEVRSLRGAGAADHTVIAPVEATTGLQRLFNARR
jgi:serine/threonine-protein kinase